MLGPGIMSFPNQITVIQESAAQPDQMQVEWIEIREPFLCS